MFARGTLAQVRRQMRRRCRDVPASKRAMNALASVAIEFGGTMRSRRQASTAASSSAPDADGCPARARSSARRRRFSLGPRRLGRRPGGGQDAAFVRDGGPAPEDLHREVPHRPNRQFAETVEEAARRPESSSLGPRARDRALHVHGREVRVDRRVIGLLRGNTARLAQPRAAGCGVGGGNGSSENQESAMKRPVPDGHITSPPQSVSMPSMASAISRSSRVHQARLLLLQRAPNQR